MTRSAQIAFLLLVIETLLLGCAAKTSLYVPPDVTDNIATIEDDYPNKSPLELRPDRGRDLTLIISIDRKVPGFDSREAPYFADDDEQAEYPIFPISIAGGTHKLHVRACELSMSGYKCGDALLTLDVLGGHRYRVMSDVSKDRNHADIWIEDADGTHVTKVVRAHGLSGGYFWCETPAFFPTQCPWDELEIGDWNLPPFREDVSSKAKKAVKLERERRKSETLVEQP